MSIGTEYVEAIERYGYTRTEARFLYLVATHSGYFTQQQFFDFAGVNRGGMGTRLTRKALQHGHIRTARHARHTMVYNLFARHFYESIEKDNLRNRRRLSDELIRTRLLILDFVLARPDHDYLETYQPLLRCLPAFEMVYAAPNARKFHRAEAFSTRQYAPPPPVDTQRLCRYFTVRQLWESHKYGSLTRADRDLLRDGDKRYQGHLFDQTYRDWITKGLTPTEVNALINPGSERQKMAFKTHLLPESYDILDHVSIRKNRRGSGTVRGNTHSTNDSAASSTSGTRKYLKAQEQTHEQHL